MPLTQAEKSALQTDRDAVQSALNSLSAKINALVPDTSPPPSVLVYGKPSAHCWLQKRCALRHGDKTWFSVVGGVNGDRQVIVEWDHVNQTRTETDISEPLTIQKDDHNQATIHRRGDGRLLVAFTPHNGQGYTKLSTNPDDSTSWGSPNTIVTHGSYRPHCYPSIVDDGANLFLSIRQNNNGIDEWKLIPINSDGSMSSATREGIWYSPNSTTKPYVIPVSDPTNGRIHFFTTRWSQNVGTDNLEIWHTYRESNGRWYDSAGTDIGTGTGPWHCPAWDPANYNDLTRVNTEVAPVSCWIMDAAVDSVGAPMVLWQKETTGSWGSENFEFWRSRWDPVNGWVANKVCDSGSSPASAAGYFGYSGCAAFSSDTDKIFASVEVSGNHEIQRFDTSDGGVTWTKAADVTTSGTHPRWRPIPVDGAIIGEDPEVCWMDGDYPSFTTYDTEVVALG